MQQENQNWKSGEVAGLHSLSLKVSHNAFGQRSRALVLSVPIIGLRAYLRAKP
jgi:hypothetical protein